MSFTADYQEILDQIERIDPVAYGKSRNYVDGAVTRLSPYISRGVISTRQVFESVMARGYELGEIEKFVQELAWRDYWQQIWVAKGDEIDNDLKRPQPEVQHREIPKALVDAQTGIEAIDRSILEFYETGYMHNHVRMYVASIACNLGGSHWKMPARWMYYHLLDGDWASNALSWQWVAGANAGKKYIANQDNINRYCYSEQKGTFLDVSYQKLESMEIPEVLKATMLPSLESRLPEHQILNIDPDKPTLLYNYYNLDPKWHLDEEVNRVLLIEPSIFERYPVSGKAINFMLGLGKNIENLQIFVGEFEDLIEQYNPKDVRYKEHPLNKYQGVEEPRDWMSSVTGYYTSFFKFWKQAKKELKLWNQPTLFGL